MKNGVGKRTNVLVVCAFIFALAGVQSIVNANLVIDDMQISLLQTTWYNGSTNQFQLSYQGIPSYPSVISFGIVSTTISDNYDYMFDGTLSITPLNLQQDQTSQNGGRAKGIFAGGATLTIEGSLYNINTYEYIITNEIILVAQMSSADWYLEELASPPAAANLVRGSAFFSTIGGKLFNGNNSEGLTLYGFRADFTFPDVTPAITNFGSTSYDCSSPSIQTVPEPASISLFCIAAAMLMRKKTI